MTFVVCAQPPLQISRSAADECVLLIKPPLQLYVALEERQNSTSGIAVNTLSMMAF